MFIPPTCPIIHTPDQIFLTKEYTKSKYKTKESRKAPKKRILLRYSNEHPSHSVIIMIIYDLPLASKARTLFATWKKNANLPIAFDLQVLNTMSFSMRNTNNFNLQDQ